MWPEVKVPRDLQFSGRDAAAPGRFGGRGFPGEGIAPSLERPSSGWSQR